MNIKIANQSLQDLRFDDFLFELREKTKELNYGDLMKFYEEPK